jgi:undecaprenyl-diphosphatase
MTESLLDFLLLGILEGLTEFLPVSSTGHLILAAELLGFTGPQSATFKIVIQLGAILAVLVAYRQRFGQVLAGLPSMQPGPVAFTRNILLAFLPSVVIGLIAYKSIKAMIETPEVVAVALIVGGILILLIERMTKRVTITSVEAMSWRTALGIGFVQCLAMIPGVSRSGATIMGALLLGVERKTAAEFSFFLAVPTMIAATSYDLFKSWDQLGGDDLRAIAIGFASAFVVALLVVKAFVAVVGRFGFAPFAWYRIVIGSVALVWLLNR